MKGGKENGVKLNHVDPLSRPCRKGQPLVWNELVTALLSSGTPLEDREEDFTAGRAIEWPALFWRSRSRNRSFGWLRFGRLNRDGNLS